MNINMLSHTSKVDIATGAFMLVCIVAVAAAIEISAPVIAGIGAVSAAATGVVRLAYAPKKSE